MKKVMIDELDADTSLFHFSKRYNRQSIEENGIVAVAGGENEVMNDSTYRTIYFSKGFEGVLKAVDVWVRYEYYQLYRNRNETLFYEIIKKSDNMPQDQKLMQEAIKKVYDDFKNREYYVLELEEGKDYLLKDIDRKKRLFRRKDGSINHRAIWMYGEYSNLESDRQEDWNRNTIENCESIPSSRLSLVMDSNQRTDALSVLKEIYETMKENDFIKRLTELNALIQYANKKENEHQEREEPI